MQIAAAHPAARSAVARSACTPAARRPAAPQPAAAPRRRHAAALQPPCALTIEALRCAHTARLNRGGATARCVQARHPSMHPAPLAARSSTEGLEVEAFEELLAREKFVLVDFYTVGVGAVQARRYAAMHARPGVLPPCLTLPPAASRCPRCPSVRPGSVACPRRPGAARARSWRARCRCAQGSPGAQVRERGVAGRLGGDARLPLACCPHPPPAGPPCRPSSPATRAGWPSPRSTARRWAGGLGA